MLDHHYLKLKYVQNESDSFITAYKLYANETLIGSDKYSFSTLF